MLRHFRSLASPRLFDSDELNLFTQNLEASGDGQRFFRDGTGNELPGIRAEFDVGRVQTVCFSVDEGWIQCPLKEYFHSSF